ncbi:MAG: DUF2779 domain-containing protein [Candidatus Woesearchaeota archaeon]
MTRVLTKSKYILGLECPRHLWITFNQPEKIRKATLAEEFKFSEGDKVGQLAKTLFSDGIDLPVENYSENLEKTKESMKKGKPLFEAGFAFENCFSRADILVPAGKEWDIIEVKSGTEVKDINVHDVSFQKYVYESSGLRIRKCFLMHLNKEYFRKGKLDAKKLLVQEDITSQVNAIKGVKERIDEMFKIISLDKPSKAGLLIDKMIKEGNHDCFTENCIDGLPENHVFCLYRGGKLACELFENGIMHIKDIPLHVKLNGKQNIQRECEIEKKIYTDIEGIKQFLATLKYPVYYLDFETFSTAIPMFDGLKCYSQVPFQFSLHIAKKEGSKPEHHAFLYYGNGDSREEFALALKKMIGSKGTVLVYNQSFEIGRLKELAEFFPEHKKWIENVLKRIVDLLVPFREFRYYNPKQQGSASIKDVLPAITGKSYKGMEIGDGGTASAEFFRVTYGDCPDAEKKKVRDNLLRYCELDTMAEVLIVEKLKELI